jgi:hypothetical protein
MLQEPNITSSSLLPLTALTIELEQLGSHLERALFQLFVRLGVDFLCEADYGLEVDVGFFFGGGVFLLATLVLLISDLGQNLAYVIPCHCCLCL